MGGIYNQRHPGHAGCDAADDAGHGRMDVDDVEASFAYQSVEVDYRGQVARDIAAPRYPYWINCETVSLQAGHARSRRTGNADLPPSASHGFKLATQQDPRSAVDRAYREKAEWLAAFPFQGSYRRAETDRVAYHSMASVKPSRTSCVGV